MEPSDMFASPPTSIWGYVTAWMFANTLSARTGALWSEGVPNQPMLPKAAGETVAPGAQKETH